MAITREELIAWATRNSWKLDRYGHMQKIEHEGLRQYRLKLSRIAVRYEIKTHAGWVRVRGGYFKDLTITAGGTLTGWTR
jgi:hypothetical protein